MNPVEIAEQMINTPLPNLAHIVPNESGWSDAIEELGPDQDMRVYKPPKGRERPDYIRRRLGHISVNPHNIYNKDALTQCYVYAEDVPNVDIKSITDVYINKSRQRTDTFVEDLISRAKEARELSWIREGIDPTDRANYAAQNYHVIVHGEKGCGKTFFLNHILAKCCEKFDKELVLWARLNLVEGFENDIDSEFKYDLSNRFFAQLAKIVLRYYDPESEIYQLYNIKKHRTLSLTKQLLDFSAKVSEGNEKRFNYYSDKVTDMKRAFGTFGLDPPISPVLVPPPIGRELYRLVMENGYSIICVLDGLDRLEASAHEKRRFARLFDSAVKLTSSLGTFGIVVVSVTRSNTLNTLPDILRRPNTFISGGTTVLKLFPIDKDVILNRRTGFLRKNVVDLADREGWLLEDWPNHLDQFLSFLGTDIHTSSTARLDVFGLNRRAQMHTIQLRYFDFLKEQHERPYVYIESLVLAGQRYPPKPYRYVLTGKRNWKLQTYGTTAFDSHLLPSMFRFPYIEWEKSDVEPPPIPNPEGMLLGLRVLQILNASENLIASSHSSSYQLTAKEISHIMKALFGYPQDMTIWLITEFAEFEFVLLGRRDFPVQYLIPGQQVFMMPKGSYALRSFLYDIAYLSLCSMRIPLCIDTQGESHGFFVPASLDPPVERKPDWLLNVSEPLTKWVAAKIINSCAMFRLLNYVNKLQEQRYRKGFRDLEWRLQDVAIQAVQGIPSSTDGMFEFTKRLRFDILAQIPAMLRPIEALDPRSTEMVGRLVEEYWSVWKTR